MHTQKYMCTHSYTNQDGLSIVLSGQRAEGHSLWLSLLVVKIKVNHSKCASLDAFQHGLCRREELQRQVQVLFCLSPAPAVSRSMSLVMKQKIHLYGFMGMLYITLPILMKKKSHLFKASKLIKMVKCQTKSNLNSTCCRKIIHYQQKFPG